MDRLTYRDNNGRATLTQYGMKMYCSTQATADCFAKLEEMAPEWISVKERLPKEFENVLVANKRGKHYDIDKAWWNGSGFDRCAKGIYRNVTHWMPLPEPPKEGGGEDG